MIEDMAGVLAYLKVGKAHFVGHSMGAMISMGMAIRHPQTVASLTAMSGTASPDGMLAELVAMQRDPTRKPSPELMPLLPTESDFTARRAHYQHNAPDPSGFATLAPKLTAMPAAWSGWTEAELRSITAATMLVIGDNDFTRIERAAEMKRLIPGAARAIFPSTTYMSMLDRGE